MTAASIAARAAIVIASAAAMETVALLVHRHLMHGAGWGWHRSHHQPAADRRWERNDLYALVFASLAFALMWFSGGPRWPLFWVGAGLTLYGALYAVVHDGLVHRRLPLNWNLRSRSPRRGYLARLVQAHRLHHAVRGRDGCVSFGFLYAPPPARLAEALRQRRRAAGAGVEVGTEAEAASTPTAGADARRWQGATGLLLATLIAGGWLAAQAGLLFRAEWSTGSLLLAPLGVALVCWLDVGLFIVAHDAMHGSLAPSSPRLNRAFGRACLLLYAGFWLGRFTDGHVQHHRAPGTADDPDFNPGGNGRFWPWYGRFMRRYFGWREAAGLALTFGLLAGGLRAPLANVMVFWALPALLSSVQLFAFGTWLPHRAASAPFADHHRARSNDYGWLASLLSCFHFGYHHEHHLRPDAPWWRLPAVRRGQTAELNLRPGDRVGAGTAPGITPGFAGPAGSTSLRAAPAGRPVRATPPCSPPR